MNIRTFLLTFLFFIMAAGALAQKKGDVNGDGIVNVADIIVVSNYLQNTQTGSINMSAANVDGDNQVTVNDIVGILKIILDVSYDPSDSHYFSFYASDPYEVGAMGTGSMEEYVYVGTDIAGWTCSSDQSWCKVRNDEQCVYFRVSPHERYSDREAVVTASFEGKVYAKLTIKQRAKIFFYFEYPDGKAMPVSGGSIKVKVITNSSYWEVVPPIDSWITVTKTDDSTITLTAQAREGSTPREDQTIRISGEDARSFTITDGGESSNEGYEYDDKPTPWD